MPFHFPCRGLFAQLAHRTAIGAIDLIGVHVADELLRNRAGATWLAAHDVFDGPRDTDQVHTIVLVEAVIFDRDKRLREVFREGSQRHTRAPLRTDLTEHGTVAPEDDRGLRRL